MITTSNYIEQTRNIDFDNLPAALKNGDKLTKGAATNNWSAYNSNENIKRVVDAYIQKLNEYLKKNPPEKPKAVKSEKTKDESKKKPEPNVKKTESKKVEPEQEPEGVEKILPEVGFIKRYVGMHGKEKTQDEILRFLNSLQKAILEKRIRKTSVYAKEIENIQNQLIKCYEKMGDSIKITIDNKTIARYNEIAHSQKTMLSVTYIRQYINLHGKKDVKEKAKLLMAKMKKAVENNKVNKADPYADRLNKLYNSLNDYIENKTTSPVINKSELNGLMGMAGFNQKKSPELYGIEEEPENNEVIRSSELANMNFKTIGLQGKYCELIGDPSVGFSAMVYGLPKSGKSTLCIDFAKYLAENHGKVLYCAIEEKFGYTLKEKMDRLGANHPKLYVSEKIPDNISDYDFVFIDSISRAGFDMDYLRKLRKDNPKTSFIFIYHTTKDGKFRGTNENAHEVDVIIEVTDGKAKGNGRFGIGGNITVF
ncbi:MAG: ATP-binding protein [Bacteroidia bacterium]|nr:ATP-binding protein [Bacteroidia bacterium]